MFAYRAAANPVSNGKCPYPHFSTKYDLIVRQWDNKADNEKSMLNINELIDNELLFNVKYEICRLDIITVT